MRRVEPEEQEPERLRGWFVVEVGRRTAHPFLNLADSESGREVRLYIDTTFSVVPGRDDVCQHDDEVFAALDALTGRTVMAATATAARLDLDLDGVRLLVGLANDLTSGSPWWVGRFNE